MVATLLFIQNPNSENKELATHLKSQGYHLRQTDDVSTAIQLVDDHGLRPSAILVDIPDLSETQVELLENIDESLDILEWVFLTYDLATELVDRIETLNCRSLKQPCPKRRIDVAVKKAIRATIVRRRLKEYANHNLKKTSFDSIVGISEVVTRHRETLRELSQVPLRTLKIKGETGTGKGHAARILHSNGLRNEYPFIEMNCAAMPSELVESQLFGHEAGAFTGAKKRHRGLLEQADNGTLFLDELAEMPLDVQAKLLKAIEEQSFRRIGGEHKINVDVQIFAASNRNLQEMVVDGQFREDLYHRLTVFEITVPPLRDYKTDMVELVPLIVAEYNAHAGKHVNIIPDRAWREMLDYDWPGNVRELRNALERCIILAKGETLNTDWLNLNNNLLIKSSNESKKDQTALEERACSDNIRHLDDARDQEMQITFTLDGSITLEEIDRQIIERALKLTQQNTSKAAELLGATRETLRYRIQKYQLDAG